MARFSRDEIERAFRHYQEVALRCGTKGDWNDWVNLFTEDCTYIEHFWGTMGGREAVRRWMRDSMSLPAHREMVHFPIDWYSIDEEKGWVFCKVWNRMADPGDGSLHQQYNITILKYAGDGLWSYEEDAYNPENFRTMIRAYKAHKRELQAKTSRAAVGAIGVLKDTAPR